MSGPSDDFYIGLEFHTTTGRWRCTDVGSRLVIAIRLDAPETGWYHGPPYAVAESVLDQVRTDTSSDPLPKPDQPE